MIISAGLWIGLVAVNSNEIVIFLPGGSTSMDSQLWRTALMPQLLRHVFVSASVAL